MPTVVALDVSLSMSRPVSLPDITEEYQRRHIAIHGINSFLDHLTINYKLEFVSLVAFSYLWEQLVAFTRDYDTIKSALNKVEAFNKTCIETVLNGIRTIILDEWSNVSCQVILVTDGSLGVGVGSLKKCLQTHDSRQSSGEKFPLPFPFPCKLHIICIGNPADPDVRAALPYYQKLIDIGGQGGELVTLDGPITFKHLDDFTETHVVADEIEIIGFLDIKDVGSPPTIARHLVMPISTKEKPSGEVKEKDSKSSKSEAEEDEGQEDGKVPSFTVLLHGSLKVQGMVGIAKVGKDWYGMIYSWADSKKKSSLILALFTPGQTAVQWLGQFDHLTSCKEFLPDKVYSDEEKKCPFPVRPHDKRSYSQSCVVWIKPSGLQSDIQKILRHAKKLPDKQQQFYKELNRTRRAALSFGFLNLLEALAVNLERECAQLPGSPHPSAALQLTHAADCLRSEIALNPMHTIMPLQTNFDRDR